VQEFDQWRSKFELQDADRAGRMHLIAAASLFQLGRRDQAARHIEEGLRRKPQDQQLLVQLQTLAEVFSGELGSGTGFVIAPGYLLTNQHVIAGPGRIVVLASGGEDETPAELVAEDEEHDMALLRVAGAAAEAPPLALAPSQAGRGARVAAFGYPLGNALGKGLKLTTGVVSGAPEASADNMYLLDCRINPGNSGGPLCDRQGRVLGMVTAKSSISQDVDSYGMAIPADVLAEFLQSHVPGWSPSPGEAPAAMEWDEVDRAVSASVLMVVKKQ
jgi:S1-C subfamily serine protease